MKKALKNTLTLIAGLFFMACLAQTAWATPFQNGDFETGDFTGWSGDLINTGVVDPDSDSHFTIVSNEGPNNSYVAKVENDNDYDWQAALFQDFTLDVLNGPGWTMDITFWLQWTPGDSSQDEISVQIQDTGVTDSLDLLAGISDSDLMDGTWVTQDISTFAQTWGGQDVELMFTITDYNGQDGKHDSLLIDNISFQQHPAPVPEPSTVVLLGFGLAGIVGLRKKRVF